MPKKKHAALTPSTLLVELLTEELPPKSLLRIAEVFRDALASNLNGSSLVASPYHARCFASPRRLAVLIPNVVSKAADEPSERSGPSVAAGPKAAEGFARKHGVTVDALKRLSTEKGEVYVASYTTKGAQLDEVLPGKVEAALKVLPISKVMRWGEGQAQFVRPVRGLVMMHGKRVVPGTVLGVRAGTTTSGHRFMGAASIRLSNADDYEARLLKVGDDTPVFEQPCLVVVGVAQMNRCPLVVLPARTPRTVPGTTRLPCIITNPCTGRTNCAWPSPQRITFEIGSAFRAASTF